MVSKENGFNQSEKASCCCARTLWCFPGSRTMARDSEVIQRQHFCHHGDTICHPKSDYVTTKPHGTFTCGCNNNAMFSGRAIFTFPTVVVCRPRYSGPGKALTVYAKMQIWQHCWNHYFSCSRFPFCLSTVSNIMIIYCKVVEWDIM